jgi:putative hydrolase of the HAD superfamily
MRMNEMTLKAVIFDLDDTLLVEVESARKEFMACCNVVESRYGIDSTRFYETIRSTSRELWRKSPARDYAISVAISSWEALWANFKGDHPKLSLLRKWAPFYRIKSWESSLNEFNIKDNNLASHLANLFMLERDKNHIVYPDVIPNLKSLKSKFKLGLITNGLPSHQRYKLSRTKLAQFFDVIVISGEYIARKPDPLIFSILIKKLGVYPEEAVIIGNSLNSDIKGGIQSKIKTIWMNRENNENKSDIKPDFEISSLNDIERYLNKLDAL